MPAVAVGLPVGETGAGVAAADELVVAVAVEVGDRGRREHRVSLEPREPAQHGAVAGAQRVRVLAERSCLHAVAPGVVAHRQGSRDARMGHRVGARVGLLDEPLVPPGVGDGLVAANRGIAGVAGPDEDRVGAAGRDGSDRRRGLDRRAGVVGPTGHARSVAEVVRVDLPGEVADDDRRLPVQVGHVRRGEGDGVAGVGERRAPREVRVEAGRVRHLVRLGDGCRLHGGRQDQSGGASHHCCGEEKPPCTSIHISPLGSGAVRSAVGTPPVLAGRRKGVYPSRGNQRPTEEQSARDAPGLEASDQMAWALRLDAPNDRRCRTS